MTAITTLFWDVGGILLTNGWDTKARKLAAKEFGLDWGTFQDRHESVVADFEVGRITIDEYLEATVFHIARDFRPETFKEFMFAQSQPREEMLAFLAELAASGKYLLCTLNNESFEINEYRIDKFEFRKYFTAFFSSCYLGCKKPSKVMFRTALQITHRRPEECVYLDDREGNVEAGHAQGLHAIHFRDREQCVADLHALGVVP